MSGTIVTAIAFWLPPRSAPGLTWPEVCLSALARAIVAEVDQN